MTVLLGLSGWLSPMAEGQAYLYNEANFATGNKPAAAVAADFNGDGKLDLAVANQADNTVSILLGKPDGTFATHVDYATGTSPVALVAADFNGDGRLDLAVINSQANTVSILIGNGDGTFGAHTDYSTGNNPVGVVATDFNGDKKIDLAVANQNDSTVSIFLGNGDGTFQSQTTVKVDKNPVALARGDFNGDGKVDLITSNNNSNLPNGDGTVSVLLGRGDGTFARADSDAGYAPGALAVGDFNNDGKLDVVVVNLITSMSVLLGKGDGTFQLPQGSAPNRFVAPSILAADVNHDGKLDLVAAGNGLATVLVGDGDGTFQPPKVFAYLFGNILLSADFNGDGLPDLLFADSNSVSVLLGNGDTTFRTGADYNLLPVSPSVNIGPGPAIVADFNGDGIPDVAVFEPDNPSGSISVLLGKGDGSFQAARSTPATALSVIDIVSGDFNGDGKTDLAAETDVGGSRFLSVFLGNGDGTFQPSIDEPSPPNTGTSSLATGDFNGDGKLDLAITASDNSGNESVQILLGQGNGKFQTGASYPLSMFIAYSPLVVGDFNHDGRSDLAAGNGETVAVLIGNGDGTFQNPVYYNCGHFFIGGLAQSDFNGDGKEDLVVSTYDGVSVLLGNGDGTFRPHVDSNFVGIGTIVGDFNGDGKADLATANSIAMGNGDGTFQPPRFLVLTPSAAAPGDFNADGISDLALVTQDLSATPSVSIFLSAPYVAFYPSPIKFASQTVGTPSTTEIITVTNIGNAPMSISGIAASGDFSQTNTCGSKLAIAANCTVSVIFTPTATGMRNGALTFADNVVTSPQMVGLTGAGVVPVVGLSGTSLTFASQAFATTSSSQTVTLSNTGAGSLSIASYAFGGANQGDFAQTNTCGASVAAGANCTISVTFTPQGVGARTATLTITDNNNGVNSSTQTIVLTGTGAVATPAVNWTAPASIVYGTALGAAQLNAASPVQGAFTYNPPAGTVLTVGARSIAATFAPTNTVDYTSSTQTVQITVRQAPLAVTAANVSRNYGSPNPPLTGAITGLVNNDNITATYSTTATAASAPGAYPITPALSDPSGRLPNYAVTLNNGTLTVISVALVSLSTPSVDFGSEIVGGTSGIETVTLKNTGTATLSLASIAASGDFVAGNNCGGSVAANASCAINVTFKPAAGGNRTGTLTIADNAAGSPQAVALAGTGQDFSFGAPAGGSTSASVSRGGTATYNLSVGTLGGLNQAISFSCTGAPSEATCAVTPPSLTPGAAVSTITVTVTTTAASMLAPLIKQGDDGDNGRIMVFGLMGLTGLAGLLLLSFGGLVRRRPCTAALRLRWSLVAPAAILLLALMMAACGGGGGGSSGGGGNPGTPAGTYTLTVAATVTSGTTVVTHDVSLTLQVQ